MNSKTWISGLALGVVLAVAGCSGGSTPGGDGDGGNPDADGTGSLDCAAIDTEKLAEYGLYVQLLAQLSAPDQLATFTSFGFTPEKFDAALDNLEPVRTLGAGQYGDPGEALDFYRELNDTAAELLAKGDAVTQADIDAFVSQSGGVDGTLLKQIAINAPLSDACPDLDA